MTEESERRSCDLCKQKGIYAKLKDDYYNHQDVQIEKDKECDMIMKNLDERSRGTAQEFKDFILIQLPALKKSINITVGAAGLVGLLFTANLFYVRYVSSSVAETDSIAHENSAVAREMKVEMRNLSENIQDLTHMIEKKFP